MQFPFLKFLPSASLKEIREIRRIRGFETSPASNRHRHDEFPAFVGGDPFARRVQPLAEPGDDEALVELLGAGKNIHRGELMLRPRVQGDVAFGDHDDAAQAMRAELMEDVGDVGAARVGDRPQHLLAQATGIIQPGEVALVEIDQGVPGESHERIERAASWPQ